jgi:hypothetical protein
MTIRKRNDDEGWKRGVGAYTGVDSGLRNKLPDEATAPAAKNIYNNVCKNSLDDDAGGSRPGPIKYGVG